MLQHHVTRKEEGVSIRQGVLKAMMLHPELREASNSERLIAYVRAIPGLERVKSATIDRTRRLVQRQHPDLRGRDWERNQRHSRYAVAKQIKEDTWGRTMPFKDLASYIFGEE
jgi:hypothetical protein